MHVPIAPALPLSLASAIKRNNLNLQFFFYEGGNLIAAIAGAGGLGSLARDLESLRFSSEGPVSVWLGVQRMMAGYPELTIVLSILLVAIIGPILRDQSMRLIPGRLRRPVGMGVDVLLTGLALTILVYSLIRAAAPIACAAAAFVVSSALFRQAADRPLFLKIGACALALGGAFLTLTGLAGLSGGTDRAVLLALLTALTGAAVVLASLLAYEGGMHACRNAPEIRGPMHGIWDWLLHSQRGIAARALSRLADRPVTSLNRIAQKTVLRPIPPEIRATSPFITAMWVRLPWRVLTGAAAVASGAWAFAVANLAWAMGDVAMASIDWGTDKN